MPISPTEGYFENPKYRFLEEPMLFFGLKMKPLRKKCFPVLRPKVLTNRNVDVKLAEKNNHPFLLSI